MTKSQMFVARGGTELVIVCVQGLDLKIKPLDNSAETAWPAATNALFTPKAKSFAPADPPAANKLTPVLS